MDSERKNQNTESEFSDSLCGQSGMPLRMPFFAQEAEPCPMFNRISSWVKGQVATKRDMSPNQEFYCVRKGKMGYFGFAEGPEGHNPLKVPPEVQAQSGLAGEVKGLLRHLGSRDRQMGILGVKGIPLRGRYSVLV